MSDHYEAGDAMEDKRTGPGPDAADREDEEWVDEAEEGPGPGSQEEWVEEAPKNEWEEETPAGEGKPKPKETPAYMTWVAGLIGLLIGLYAFRGCGGR